MQQRAQAWTFQIETAASISMMAIVVFAVSCFSASAWALNAPGNLKAAPASTQQINLTWGDTNSQESGYLIEQSLSPSSGFSQIGTSSVNSTSYQSSGLAAGTTYYFRVRAFRNINGGRRYSIFSNIASAATTKIVSATPTPAPTPAPTPTPPPATPTPTPTTSAERIYGVTITNPWNQMSAIITSLKSFGRKATARIVFDEFVPASEYTQIVSQVKSVSFVMGEILDSFYMPQYTVTQYLNRTTEYLNAMGANVDIWEIGNEINGEWLGDNTSVVQKMSGAYDLVKARGYKAALTLYYNDQCWSKASNEMFTWAQANVPDRMKQGLDYVFVSFYEDDCNGIQPDWAAVFQKLGAMFPNSKIGFGETGTIYSARKETYINRYYRMNITHPRYVLGGFWWYFDASQSGGAGDMVPSTNYLWSVLNNAILANPTTTTTPPTTTSSQIPMTSAEWFTAYDGFGTVKFDSLTGSVVFAPMASTQATETHATLLLANRYLSQGIRNFRITVNATTEAQLRSPTPNAWECFWLFFNYATDVNGKKLTNYFTLKPNGYELGRAFDELGQQFLATGASPQLVIGRANTFVIEKIYGTLKVSVDGVQILSYDSATGPYPLYDVAGTIGLYTEDARVRVNSVRVDPL